MAGPDWYRGVIIEVLSLKKKKIKIELGMSYNEVCYPEKGREKRTSAQIDIQTSAAQQTGKRGMLLGDYGQMNKCDKTFEQKQKMSCYHQTFHDQMS